MEHAREWQTSYSTTNLNAPLPPLSYFTADAVPMELNTGKFFRHKPPPSRRFSSGSSSSRSRSPHRSPHGSRSISRSPSPRRHSSSSRSPSPRRHTRHHSRSPSPRRHSSRIIAVSPARSESPPLRCYICKKSGHEATNCPNANKKHTTYSDKREKLKVESGDDIRRKHAVSPPMRRAKSPPRQ